VLANIAPLYASGSDKTNFYALLLRSTDEQQHTVSGILSLHTATARYDVPFSGAVAAGLTATAAAPAVVVRFPQNVSIERGLLAQANGKSCAPFTVLNPSAFTHFLPQPSDLAAAAADVSRITAPAPIAEAPPPCAGPDAAPTMADARHPVYPTGMGSAALKIAVLVLIGDDGTLIAAAVADSSGKAAADTYALQSAAGSTYRNGVKRCTAIGTTITLRFQVKPR
jgi:outer membrane biosynthesis protein TonB